MAGQGAAQPNQSDTSTGILWVVAVIFAVCGVVWYAFKRYIIIVYFKIKLFEIAIISYFTSNLQDVRTTILSSDPNNVTFQDIVKIGQAVGDDLRIPFVVLISLLAAIVYFTSSTRTFKHNYSMRDLVRLEQQNWPQITPVVNLDIVHMDLDSGPWAMAMTPMQFCKKYRLVEEIKNRSQEGVARKDRQKIEIKLNRGEANKIFFIQLGLTWPGINKLPLHVKALFAVFAARMNGDGKAAAALLKKINVSSAKKLDFSGTAELIAQYGSTKVVEKITHSHAYVMTVMASMLEGARTDGVQAAADFLWLKPLDRRLWYVLNTIGRQTPFVEVAGIFAHWLAEKEAGRKLMVPVIEEATNALDIALKEIIYRSDEEGV